MNAYVVDTNVAIVANNDRAKTPQANPQCILACIGKLRQCIDILKGKREGKLALDGRGEIEAEYAGHLNRSGQPGVGDEFLFEINRQSYGPHCERVSITPLGESYAEFPDDPELASLDRNDRKFVAVAITSRIHPAILDAVDSDWLHHQARLEAAGVRVEQLCLDCLSVRD